MKKVSIQINGNPFQAEENAYLSSVLKKEGIFDSKGIAVAVNNIVIPKSNWEITLLKENDSILIINASQGG